MTTKRFLRIQIFLVIILAIAIIGNTFAWDRRPKVQGGGFMGNGDSYFTAMRLSTPEGGYFINGTGCTAITYTGTRNESTGVITYTETAVTPYEDKEFRPGDVHYFKTVIKNNSSADTNVSLFIDGEIDQALSGRGFRLDVMSPVVRKDDIEASGAMDSDGNRAFKWLPIVRSLEVKAGKEVDVEWTLCNTFENTYNKENFEISRFILTNN